MSPVDFFIFWIWCRKYLQRERAREVGRVGGWAAVTGGGSERRCGGSGGVARAREPRPHDEPVPRLGNHLIRRKQPHAVDRRRRLRLRRRLATHNVVLLHGHLGRGGPAGAARGGVGWGWQALQRRQARRQRSAVGKRGSCTSARLRLACAEAGRVLTRRKERGQKYKKRNRTRKKAREK